MQMLKYFAILSIAGAWYAISTITVLLMAPFMWKKPRLTWIFARISSIPLQKLLGYKIVVHGAEHLNSDLPAVFVANHQSNMDVITMGTIYVDGTVCIGKKELGAIPLFGQFVIAGGNILIDRKNIKHSISGLDQAKDEMLRRNVSVWIFPEGTRNRGADEMLPFKRGAFHLAIAAQRPVIAIVGPPVFSYFNPKRKRITPGVIEYTVLPPFSTKGLTSNDVNLLTERVRKAMEEALASHKRRLAQSN